MPALKVNPNNPCEGYVFLNLRKKDEAGNSEHPQAAMYKLSKELGFEVFDCLPEPVGDGWSFWIRFDKAPELPDWFNKHSFPWRPQQCNA